MAKMRLKLQKKQSPTRRKGTRTKPLPGKGKLTRVGFTSIRHQKGQKGWGKRVPGLISQLGGEAQTFKKTINPRREERTFIGCTTRRIQL